MNRIILLGAIFLMASCTGENHNTLTEAEIADGWELLFDGKTLDGWKDYNGETLTQPWHVVDGCIHNQLFSFEFSSLKQANTNLSSSNSGLAKLFSEI